MDWRKIEQALVEIAQSEGYDCDEETRSGDKYINPNSSINATELAKELAERLK